MVLILANTFTRSRSRINTLVLCGAGGRAEGMRGAGMLNGYAGPEKFARHPYKLKTYGSLIPL
jgi:hypothetical protein